MALPLALVVAWFLGLRHASLRLFMAIALLLAALGAALYWISERRVVTGPYSPARLQDGRVVPEGTP